MDELQSPNSIPGNDNVFYVSSGLGNGQKSKHKGGDHEEEHSTGVSQKQGRNG